MCAFSVNQKNQPWTKLDDTSEGQMKRKILIDQGSVGCSEFVFGYAELESGQKLPLHINTQSQCDYIIQGRAWVQLGKRRVELNKNSATYFPPNIPHTYEVVGNETLRLVYTFACEKTGQGILNTPAGQEEANKYDIDNMWQTRWAVADDFVPWELWEPSKGKRGMTWKTLFDQDHGTCKSMVFGTGYLPPGCRYSLHTHAQPEIYYCFSGRGEIFIGDTTVEVQAGTAVYVPREVIHGAQNRSTEPMRLVWVYGTESTSGEWSWTPAEDIYLEARYMGDDPN
jgi:quercetin dioxygenase-like cupin family protein